MSSLSLDNASAATFAAPGMWIAIKRNWNLAIMNTRPSSGALLVSAGVLVDYGYDCIIVTLDYYRLADPLMPP